MQSSTNQVNTLPSPFSKIAMPPKDVIDNYYYMEANFLKTRSENLQVFFLSFFIWLNGTYKFIEYHYTEVLICGENRWLWAPNLQSGFSISSIRTGEWICGKGLHFLNQCQK